MKVVDALQKDFAQEVREVFSDVGDMIDVVLAEDLNDNLLHSKVLRPGDSFSFYSLPLYVVTRLIQPKIVLETGTQNGGSAQAILEALRVNDEEYDALGTLFAIDSGPKSTDGSHRLTKGMPGEKITKELKTRFRMIIGFSYDELPKLLDKLQGEGRKVDLFFHDSDHAKKCVEFEMKIMAGHVERDGLVGLHDHYGQWNHDSILHGFDFVIGSKRPATHRKDGQYHNVLRLFKKI